MPTKSGVQWLSGISGLPAKMGIVDINEHSDLISGKFQNAK